MPPAGLTTCQNSLTGGFGTTPLVGMPAMRWRDIQHPDWQQILRLTLSRRDIEALAAGLPIHPEKLRNLGIGVNPDPPEPPPSPPPSPEYSDSDSEFFTAEELEPDDAPVATRAILDLYSRPANDDLGAQAALLWGDPDDDNPSDDELAAEADARRDLIRQGGVCTSTLPCVELDDNGRPVNPRAPPRQTTRILDANFNSGILNPYQPEDSEFPVHIIKQIAEMATGGWLLGRDDLEAVIRYGQAFRDVFIIYIEQINTFYQEMGLDTLVMLFNDIVVRGNRRGRGAVTSNIIEALIESIVTTMFRKGAPDMDMTTYIGNQRNLINEILNVVNNLLWRAVGFDGLGQGAAVFRVFLQDYKKVIDQMVRFMQDVSNGFISKLIKLMFIKGMKITWVVGELPAVSRRGVRQRIDVPFIVINIPNIMQEIRIPFTNRRSDLAQLLDPMWRERLLAHGRGLFGEFIDAILRLYNEHFDSDDLPVSRRSPK